MQHPLGMCTAGVPKASNEFQMFPAGKFRTQDGRPKELNDWVMTAQIARRLIEAFQAKKNPMVVDYEHQTALAAGNGKPAPAAGWVHGLEWREGQGLYAVDVKWTEAARASIQADEYRYISPTFHYSRETGEVLHLVNAALTNSPALDGMEAAVALRLTNEAQGEELAALRLEKHNAVIGRVVDSALHDARLLPWQKEAALKLGAVDLAALETLLDRPALVPVRLQSDEVGSAALALKTTADVSGLTAADLRMCELTGRTPEDFAALKQRFASESNPTESNK